MGNDTNRTKVQAMNDIAYGERLNYLHAKLYRRFDWAMNTLSVVAGSGALIAFFATHPLANQIASAGLLVAGVVNIFGRYGAREAVHNELRKRYLRLEMQAEGMDLPAIDAALRDIWMDEVHEIEPMRTVAWNDTVQQAGYTERQPEGIGCKLMRLLA